ncbi:unnamed protein product, partial [Mesorhabditis belari]|uniref:Uncharacterized protein n=1 Tax=Mesorhabditis belari TaxID=2138241 RepID=A0AAF3JAZ2_9BILA
MSRQGSRHTTPSPSPRGMSDEFFPVQMRPSTPRLVETPIGSHCRNCLQYIEHIKQLEKYIDRVHEENRNLVSTNKTIRETYGKLYSKAEQEEEYISNVLLKRIQKLKAEKEVIAQKYEQEEERIAINLMKKMQDVQAERDSMQQEMKKEHAEVIDSLMKTVRKTETELEQTRKTLDRMRKEKIDQENALETEQEMLYNTLGKQMEHLNNDKKRMERIINAAYQRGFVDPEVINITPPSSSEMIAIVNPLPERPMPAISPDTRGNELRVTRHNLRVVQQQLQEYQQAEIAKDNQIRLLQDTIAGLIKEKEDYCRVLDDMKRSFNDRFDQCLAASSAVTPFRMEPHDVRESSMGPPSVPQTPRPIHDSVSDMDDASSRGSHRDE